MDSPEDHASPTASSESTPITPDHAESPAEVAAPAETAAAATEPTASDSTAPTKINLPAALVIDHAERIAPDDHEQAWNGPSESKQPSWLSQHTRLAAGFALAMMLGGLAGAATTAFVSQPPTPAPAKATNPNLAVQQSLARLENEVASVKAGIAAAQRSTGAQFGKLSERIDRAEKAQAEPGQKLSKIIESLDRVEHKMPQAGVLPPPVRTVDVTGSVTVAKAEPPKPEPKVDAKVEPKQDAKTDAKPDAKPPLAEGWHLLDVYAGRAVVESRNGRLFEIGPGSNLPELGRVEGIKRENGKVFVVTKNGIIVSAAIERRRLPRFLYDD
jgi:hypothetical protein